MRPEHGSTETLGGLPRERAECIPPEPNTQSVTTTCVDNDVVSASSSVAPPSSYFNRWPRLCPPATLVGSWEAIDDQWGEGRHIRFGCW
ncbi:unnamed protein product [Nippostrongylus brasiliensis]|uniref:Uncharacterized protein n=1 Tax=Nippostrongylus brasiliensis TaxID=27835 RepID=A0A0N4Y078_NIPBR|nr:hypothetical protein Q1695_003360 [Nippostrongylus brasiliensis]VDL72493.1 unnamed protein product [Nippostrongylus brasiliensis]